MLGTSRKLNERSFMLYKRKGEHAPLLVRLARLSFGSRFYSFTCKNIKYIKVSRSEHTIYFAYLAIAYHR